METDSQMGTVMDMGTEMGAQAGVGMGTVGETDPNLKMETDMGSAPELSTEEAEEENIEDRRLRNWRLV